jgi:hypothetical protein
LVSTPEEMPVNETLQLARELKEAVKMTPELVVLNGFIEPRFDSADLAAVDAGPLSPMVQAHAQRSEQSSSAQERLLRETELPVLPLPRLHIPMDRRALEQLAQALDPIWSKR